MSAPRVTIAYRGIVVDAVGHKATAEGDGVGVFVGVYYDVNAERTVATFGVGEVVKEVVTASDIFIAVPVLIDSGVVPSVFATGGDGVLVGGVGRVKMECQVEIYGAVASVRCFQCVAFCSWVGTWNIDVTIKFGIRFWPCVFIAGYNGVDTCAVADFSFALIQFEREYLDAVATICAESGVPLGLVGDIVCGDVVGLAVP